MDDDDDDGFGVKEEEEEEEEEIKKKYWKLEGFPSIMNLRIFFLLHTDPSYTYRIMPPSLHLSPSISLFPLLIFLSTHSPSCPSSLSLTHFHTLPIRKKKKHKNTHKTNTSYLPNDLPTLSDIVWTNKNTHTHTQEISRSSLLLFFFFPFFSSLSFSCLLTSYFSQIVNLKSQILSKSHPNPIQIPSTSYPPPPPPPQNKTKTT